MQTMPENHQRRRMFHPQLPENGLVGATQGSGDWGQSSGIISSSISLDKKWI